MVADVPVGAFLSGGIDSSMVVALMQQHSDRPVRTFTVGFADRGLRRVGRGRGGRRSPRHRAHIRWRSTEADALALVPRLPDIWDEPFGDVSEDPDAPRLDSWLAREVTVALSGDGGDELFAGYNRHAWLERIWRRSSAAARPPFGG